MGLLKRSRGTKPSARRDELLASLDPGAARDLLTKESDSKLRLAALALQDKQGKRAAKALKRSDRATAGAAKRADKTAAKIAKKSDKAAVKAAKLNAKAAAEGKFITVNKAKRYVAVAKILAPALTPVVYRAATSGREKLTQLQADRAGIPAAEFGQFSGHGAKLSARVVGAGRSIEQLLAKNPRDAETQQFAAAITSRLQDLSSAIDAAEVMPAGRRRTAHGAISRELDAIDADILARLGIKH